MEIGNHINLVNQDKTSSFKFHEYPCVLEQRLLENALENFIVNMVLYYNEIVKVKHFLL